MGRRGPPKPRPHRGASTRLLCRFEGHDLTRPFSAERRAPALRVDAKERQGWENGSTDWDVPLRVSTPGLFAPAGGRRQSRQRGGPPALFVRPERGSPALRGGDKSILGDCTFPLFGSSPCVAFVSD